MEWLVSFQVERHNSSFGICANVLADWKSCCNNEILKHLIACLDDNNFTVIVGT